MDDQAADYVASALHALKSALETQYKLQMETNELIRSLIDTLQQTGQATADLAAAMVEDD